MNNNQFEPTEDEVNKYTVNSDGAMEVITNPLYHRRVYPKSGFRNMTFFQTARGGPENLSLDSTNMTRPGALPEPQFFVVKAISIDLAHGGNIHTIGPDAFAQNAQDIYDVGNAGSFIFTIGTKNYIEAAPVGSAPASHAIDIQTSATGNDESEPATIHNLNHARFGGNMFYITPLTLIKNQDFRFEINFDAPVPISTDGIITVKLYGNHYRSVM